MLTETITALFAGLVPAVTVIERMQAVRRTSSSIGLARPWFFLGGVLAIIGLVILLCVVHGQVVKKRQNRSGADFDANAERYGLTVAERRLLMTVARLSGISDIDLIYSTQDAFFRGSAKLMQQRYAAGDSIEDRHRLKEAIEILYGKLGFSTSFVSVATSTLGPSSRQIPVDRQVSCIISNSDNIHRFEATVSSNNDKMLVLRYGGDAGIAPQMGDKLRVRYNFGVLTWEFESEVISVYGSDIGLKHSDLARFANRRRFLRVPVQGKAMVARCSFEHYGANVESAIPQFTMADVTEIAGPGVRISTSLPVEEGERLLLVMNTGNDLTVRSMAEVKHVQKIENGWSVAMELITLSDTEVSTLVRLTNQAARNNDSNIQADADSDHIVAGKA